MRNAAVITISDKGYVGERVDTSGPALAELLKADGWNVVHSTIVPDDEAKIVEALCYAADDLKVALVLTTGGTGFARRDVTPEATLKVISKRTPGISELMRMESMKITPNGCLSRGEAGIRDNTLIINLPGSEKAVRENYGFIRKPLHHALKMLMSEGSAECASGVSSSTPVKYDIPSISDWLKEAKADASASNCGMYLFHNGVVRITPKSVVREGAETEAKVKAMRVSCDKALMESCVESARLLPGIYYVKAWINEGELSIGDDIMLVLIGGDIRPNVINALQYLVSRLKKECITEEEIYE